MRGKSLVTHQHAVHNYVWKDHKITRVGPSVYTMENQHQSVMKGLLYGEQSAIHKI